MRATVRATASTAKRAAAPKRRHRRPLALYISLDFFLGKRVFAGGAAERER